MKKGQACCTKRCWCARSPKEKCKCKCGGQHHGTATCQLPLFPKEQAA